MKQVAEGVWRLSEFPPRPVINVYLAGDVLVDAGRRWDTARIRKQTADRDLSLLALTHVHPDHQGAAKTICTERDIPLACHVADVDAMEGRRQVQEAGAGQFRNKLIKRFWEGPPYEVKRPFDEGDDVIPGFATIHAPGHQRGEVIFWRESDRVAICGDVVRNMSYLTTLAGVREPPDGFTLDVAENRRSIRKLADLKPEITLPGHGPEIRGYQEIEDLAQRVGV
jgi:glyoxylase-like metal-dependent hydrolase (beta-lactamase superfamily II)